MSIGDLVRCVSKAEGEPEVGSVGVVVKSYDDCVVAFVKGYGVGRIWQKDWQVVSGKTSS